MTEANDRPEQEALLDALTAVSRLMVLVAARCYAAIDTDVTMPHYRVLMKLASHGPQRTVDIARELCVVPSAATRIIDRLVDRRLVRRLRRADDRRTVYVGLAPAGQDLVAEVLFERRQRFAELVQSSGLHASDETIAFLLGLVVAAGMTPDPQWWKPREEPTTGAGPMWQESS